MTDQTEEAAPAAEGAPVSLDPSQVRTPKRRSHRSREQHKGTIEKILSCYPPGPEGLQAALAEVDKAYPGTILTADGVLSVAGIGEFGPRADPTSFEGTELYQRMNQTIIELSEKVKAHEEARPILTPEPTTAPLAPYRAEVAVTFDHNPLARILAWVDTHGVPAVEQLQQLVALAEHVEAKLALKSYTKAFATLQQALKPVTPTSSSTFGPYATLGDIVSAVREPLAANGFALSFKLSEVQSEAGIELTLTTLLAHVDGHSESCTITVPVEIGPISGRTGEAVRSVAQARAAATTAARRLSVLALLNLTTGEPEQETQPTPQGPMVPEGAEAAEQALLAVTDRAGLLETWGKLPFVMRRYFQAEKPQLLESLKAKFPEPAPPANGAAQ